LAKAEVRRQKDDPAGITLRMKAEGRRTFRCQEKPDAKCRRFLTRRKIRESGRAGEGGRGAPQGRSQKAEGRRQKAEGDSGYKVE
jgi:hypothetical protein